LARPPDWPGSPHILRTPTGALYYDGALLEQDEVFMVKLLVYVALGFVVVGTAVLLLTQGPAPESHPAILFGLIVLFGIPPFGAFWMMYMSIRHEKNPFPMLALALFVPFTFLWYYFERVRSGKVGRIRDSA
jgi:hypothetical protein